jgi:hypothetical protein
LQDLGLVVERIKKKGTDMLLGFGNDLVEDGPSKHVLPGAGRIKNFGIMFNCPVVETYVAMWVIPR